MNAAECLRRLGAGPGVRSALCTLPHPFADAFAAEAWALVSACRVPLRPADAAPLPIPPGVAGPARDALLTATALSPSGVAPLAVARWRIVAALLRLDAGRLLAACNAFRAVILPAWEAANGRPLFPAGGDWPPLPSREFVEYD